MDLLLSNRWLPLLATLGAVALVLNIGITNLNEIRQIQVAADHSATPTPETVAASQTQAGQSDLAAISNWHLFGEAKPDVVPTTPKPVVQRTDAPKTRLKLTLQGIFSPTVAGQKGWAIIEAPGENPKAYQIGDEVPGGATLTAVEVDQVILTRNNRPESLPLEKQELSEDSVEIDEYADEPEPAPMAPQRPRTRARARAAPPTVSSPEMESLPSDAPLPGMEPEMQPDMGYEPETEGEPKEAVPSSPAVKAAEQDLIEEMKRLRESFKNSQ